MTLHGCTLRALTVFGALMLGQPGVSAQPQTAALSLEDFSDRLTKDVPVSGRMLVGVAGVTAKGKMPLGLPAPRVLWRGTEKEVPKEPLCVSFASRDGQYFGEGRVRVADLVKQTTPFPVTAKPNPEAKKVVDLQPFDDFAVLVSSGDCRLGATSDKTKVHVIDYETDLRAPGPRTLAIAINSMTYTISVAASEGSWSGRHWSACCCAARTRCTRLWPLVR